MARYTQIPVDTIKQLQINAGIMVSSFTPSTGAYEGLLAATSGGISFNSNPSYTDFGEDIDNCPKNTMELKRVTEYDPVLSGTMLTIDADKIKMLMAAASVTAPASTGDATKITPSMELSSEDFGTLWFVGDYSSDNAATTGGFIAIKLMNALNTTGFQLQTTDKGKGQFAFEFHGHMSLTNQSTVPFEIYIKSGSAETAGE